MVDLYFEFLKTYTSDNLRLKNIFMICLIWIIIYWTIVIK